LKEKYLEELELVAKIVLIVNDPDIDKTKIQSYLVQIDYSKLRRKDIAKKWKD
jgi:hypothetical protein